MSDLSSVNHAMGRVFASDQIANAETSEQAVKGVLGLCRELSEGVRGARG